MSEQVQSAITHKFVVVLNKKIDSGVAMNACAHMAACLTARADDELAKEMAFVDYQDADGNIHPVSALSLIVLSAKNANQIRQARLEAIAQNIFCVDFTESMTKDTYVEQMERTSKLTDIELDYWGLAMFGRKVELDTITRKFSLWRGAAS